MPEKVTDDLGIPSTNVAVNGQSWTTLSGTIESRYDGIPNYQTWVSVLTGGTSDLWNLGDDDDAVTAYEDLVAYSAEIRSLGASAVIVCTVPPGYPFETGDDEAQRIAFNDLVLSSEDFDGIVDLDVDPLDDYTDVTYYSDGLHWTAAGAQVAAALVGPAVSAAIT